jgi:hypothetical protein
VRCATWRRYVDSTRGPESPTCRPPPVPRRGAPFPRQGPRRTGSPAPNGTMERSDLLRTIRPPFLVVRLAVPSRAPVFAPLRPIAGLGPGTLRCGCPTAPLSIEMEPQGLPGYQGTLRVLCRVLRPRPELDTPRQAGVPIWPPWRQQRRLQRVVLSRLNRTALALAVYASSSPLRCRRCKTRFRWLARPCRVGLATHRVPTKGFRDRYISSSSPELSWRNDALLISPISKDLCYILHLRCRAIAWPTPFPRRRPISCLARPRAETL